MRNGFQHDSVSHACSVIAGLGTASGLYDTDIRTDSRAITKHGLFDDNGKPVQGRDLNDYDAIFFFGVREIDLTAMQRADLLAFVHGDGKGFVGVHTATTAFLSWPEFGELIGGRFVNHPWGIIDAPVVVEDHTFPATRFLPPSFRIHDEMYQTRDVSRQVSDVLLRLDTRQLGEPRLGPLVNKTGDFPLAWAKMYGRGRVFYNALGHARSTWDIPEIQHITFTALKWVLRLEAGVVRPHPEQPAPEEAPAALLPPRLPCVPGWASARDGRGKAGQKAK